MKFEDFIVELQQEVEGFELYWKESRKISPKEFPMELNLGDWNEQFNIFLEIGDDT